MESVTLFLLGVSSAISIYEIAKDRVVFGIDNVIIGAISKEYVVMVY